MDNYTATVQWVYGAKSWSPERGSRVINAWHSETLKIPVDQNQKAWDVAHEAMRAKINSSDLPGRPVTEIITLSLVNLIDPSGNPIKFDRTKSFLERPVFNRVSLTLD